MCSESHSLLSGRIRTFFPPEIRELSVFLKPWSESVTEFACCPFRSWRRKAEAKLTDQKESGEVVCVRALGAAQGPTDTKDVEQDTRKRGLCLYG